MGWILLYIAIAILLVFLIISKIFSPLWLLLLTLFILWPHRRANNLRPLFFISLFLLCVYIVVRYFSVLMPFIIGTGIAYVIGPVIDTLEKRKIPRVIAILIILLPLVALAPLVIFLLTINLINELKFLITKIPDFITQSRLIIDGVIEKLNTIGIDITHEIVMNTLSNYLGTILNGLLQAVLQLGQGIKGIFLLFYNYILIPLITYLLLADREKVKLWIENLIPGEERDNFNTFIKRLNISFSRYFRGQILMMIIVGFIIGFFLWLSGIRYYVFLGITAALCNLIPNVGYIISLILAVFIGFLTPPSLISIIKILIIYLGEQLLENLLLAPLIIGKVSRLHPAVVILALMVCGSAGGLWGIILAIPLIIFLRESLNHFLGLNL